MGISNFPSGFAFGVNVRGLPLLNTYGGNIFWADSGEGSNGHKGTFDRSFATIDYAVGRCKADNGDIIMVKPGHVETVTAAAGLALDVAGITIIFLGSGANQAYVTFTTDGGADMDVDAASITLINPKFIAGIDALTGPIDINAADFTVVNGEYHDATDIETTDCIVGVPAAVRFCLNGWKYFKANEGGTQKESHIQLNGADDSILRNLHIEGDFDTGIIENVTDECLRMTMEDHYLKNTDPGNAPCAVLDSACSGWASRLNWRNADGTVVDDVADINWAPDALGYASDGYGGEPIGTASTSGIEGKIDIVTSVLSGAAGIAAFPAAGAAANDVSMAEVLRYIQEKLLAIGEATGDADIDISEADYTGYTNILTVTAPATGLAACRIDIDVNKATTGLDTIATAADTFDISLVGQVDGTNYRTIANATQITANGDGTLEASESGVSFNCGPLGPNESMQVHVKLSAERDDAELPYRVSYVGAAPTITPVAAV